MASIPSTPSMRWHFIRCESAVARAGLLARDADRHGLSSRCSHGTFATGGGDSVVSIWDPIAKKRLRQLPKYSASISALAFNASGDRLAIASAVVEEEQGTVPPGMRNSLMVRGVGDDCKPKAKA